MATTRLIVDGLGDLGPVAHWPQTELQTTASGVASPGMITLRDIGQSPTDFITGKRVTVDRGAGTDPIWTGYLMRANRRFWFPVDAPTTLNRQWVLTLVDVNILFQKRVVFKVSDPATIEGPSYLTDTYDDTVIDELVTNWLDLSADDIDTSSLVDRVALANVGQPFYPINGGMKWGQAMEIIAWLPASVWYISPDRKLVYADVDGVDAPLELSDTPGPGQAGYREIEIITDGAQLANDVAGWGFGKGSNHAVFKRQVDDDSVALHGLWQDAFVAYDIWKQPTIEAVVASTVYGSPSSKRGRKDDRFEANIVTHEHGFRVGQKARFINNEHGVDRVLPIRDMTINFEGPEAIRYGMKLSHEIDPQRMLADPLPAINIGTTRIYIPDPYIPVVVIPGVDGTPTCNDEICGITDDFQREVADAVANGDTASCGLPYLIFGNTGKAISVSAGVATMTTGTNNAGYDMYGIRPTTDAYLTVQITASGTPDYDDIWFLGADALNGDFAEVDFSTDGTLELYTDAGFGSRATTTMPFGPDQKFKIRLNAGGTDARVKVWLATDPEPSGWTLTTAFDIGTPTSAFDDDIYFGMYKDTGHSAMTATVENLVSAENTRCSGVQFESFKRDLPGEWGAATPSGYRWDTSGSFTAASVSASTGGKLVTVDSALGSVTARANIVEAGPWDSDFTFTGQFFFDAVGIGGVRATYVLVARPSSGSDSAEIQIAPMTVDGTITLFSGSGSISVGTNAVQSLRDFVQYQTYNIEWVHGRPSTGIDTVTIWPVDQPKPGTPDLTLGTGSTPGFSGGAAGPLWELDVVTAFAHVSDQWGWIYQDFDYAGRPCYQHCVTTNWVFPFDDFNRFSNANPPSIGTTSSGYVFPTSSPIGTISFEGLDGSHWFQQGGHNFNQLAPGRNDGTDLWAAEVWSMRVRFRITATPTHSSPFVGATMIFGPYATGLGIQLDDRAFDGSTGVGGGIIIGNGAYNLSTSAFSGNWYDKHDWVANTWYIAELYWDSVAGERKARVYVDGSTPPAFQITKSGAARLGVSGHYSDFGFLVNTVSSLTTYEVDVDNIEFEFSSTVCADCTGDDVVIHDEFNRTTTPGPQGPTHADFSPGNVFPTWDTTDALVYTNGSAMVVTADRGLSAPLRDGILHYPQALVTQDMLIILSTDRTPSSGDFIQIFVGDIAPDLVITATDITLSNMLGNDTASHSLNLTAGIRVRIDGDVNGVATATVWQDGSGEPSPQLSIASDPGERYDLVDIRTSIASGHSPMSTIVDDFYVEGRSCNPADPVTTGGEDVPVSGEVIENHTISSDTVFLAAVFVPGTPEVWVAGKLQFPGTYTEDPATRKITLGIDISGPTKVKIKYTVA